MSETVAVDEWLHDALTADSQLAALVGTGLWADQAPQGAQFPMVLWQLQAPSPDTVAVGGTRLVSGGLWLVRGVDQTHSFAGLLRQISDRIDEVLHGLAGATVSGVTVDSCIREQPFRLVEPGLGDAGRPVRHLGGIYRIVTYRP